MDDIDEILRKRLENLRADGSSPKASTSGVLPKVVKKSAPEQVEDLLAQLSGEISLENEGMDTGLDIDSQLQSRLERLKSREGCKFSWPKPSSVLKGNTKHELHDEEFFNSSSCSELLADLGIESDKDSLSEDSPDSEILCGVCEEKKPSLICIDCDRDYYCDKCFKSFHSDDDDEHKTVPYAKRS